MSANPLNEIDGVYTYDFTTSIDQVYGGQEGYKSISPEIYGMAGGDVDANGSVNLSDKVIWELNAGEPGYLSEDLNLDGQVNNQDKDDIWNINTDAFSSQVPE
jgi:hypothetical protein